MTRLTKLLAAFGGTIITAVLHEAAARQQRYYPGTWVETDEWRAAHGRAPRWTDEARWEK